MGAMKQDAQLATEVALMTAEHRAALKERLGRLLDQQAALLGEPVGSRPDSRSPEQPAPQATATSVTDTTGSGSSDIEITMPRVGDDDTGAVISAWLKQVGDLVSLDDPLFEVSTDKVETEIPSPFEGVLAEILVAEGEVVPIGKPVARITALGEVESQTHSDGLEQDAAFQSSTAAVAAGITPRQLDNWTRTGLVTPTSRKLGTEGQRLYSVKDILMLRVVKRLLDTGVSLQNIRVAIEHMRARGIDDLAGVTLFSDGTTVYEATSPEEIVDMLQGGQGVFGIAIGGTMKEVKAALADSESTTDSNVQPDAQEKKPFFRLILADAS